MSVPWFSSPQRICPNCQGHGRVRDSMLLCSVPCARCDGRGTIPDESENSHSMSSEEES